MAIRFFNRLSVLLVVAIAIWLLSACSEMPVPPANEQMATTAAGYGRVFGRIAYVEDGKEKDWSTSIFASDSLTLFIRSNKTGQMQYMQVEGNGSFFWPLQPGEYVIVAYHTVHKMVTNDVRNGRLWTTFSVPQPGQAVYIGDLRIEANKTRYHFEVVDQYDEALKMNEARLKQEKLEALKRLMRLEEQIGNYKRVAAICTQAWGIRCDKNYQGVEPLQPEGTARGFPVTESLMPLLEWKPSSRPEITYDIVIFESLTSVPIMRGAVVSYAEGLREPRFTPVEPLQPGKHYEWTVRLRDGDTVSSWSSTSHFTFLLIAAVGGTGQNFGFATPSK